MTRAETRRELIRKLFGGTLLARTARLGAQSTSGLTQDKLASTSVSQDRTKDPRAELPEIKIRQLTRGPKFHWRGYYDKLLFDPSNRFVVGNQVSFEHRTPIADDQINVGMIDTQSRDEWRELGTSVAWNWQQGSMLQWLPGAKPIVLWNDRSRDQFICRFVNIETSETWNIDSPIYCVSPDGTWGITTDFRRLNECRPGYGYAGLADPFAMQNAPRELGIWRVDLQTGKRDLILSIDQISRFPYQSGVATKYDPAKAKHWFNHLLIAPDGKRFVFLHRWREQSALASRNQIAQTGFSTRMLSADADGGNLHVVDPYGRTSHFVWRDPVTIMAWAWHPSHQERFYIYTDRSSQVQVIGKDTMTLNGHNTFLPGQHHEWVLNDAYPDRERRQQVYLYHVPTNRILTIGRFHSPAEYTGEWRCDTHPSANRNGTQIVFDSPHNGGRQIFLADLTPWLSKE